MSPRLEQQAARMRLENGERRLKQIMRRAEGEKRAAAVARFWQQAQADKRLLRSKWPALELEKQRNHR